MSGRRPRDDRETIELVKITLRSLLRAARGLDERLEMMRNGLAGQPRAAHYDGDVITGGRNVTWCWLHERDVYSCHAARLLCAGESITVADPTGEAAVNGDRVARDRREIDKHVAALDAHAQALDALLSAYTARAATSDERRAAAADGQPGCQSCARTKGINDQPRYEPLKVRSSRVKGKLGSPMALCGWCYTFVLRVNRLPSTAELDAHHQGRRVRQTPGLGV